MKGNRRKRSKKQSAERYFHEYVGRYLDPENLLYVLLVALNLDEPF